MFTIGDSRNMSDSREIISGDGYFDTTSNDIVLDNISYRKWTEMLMNNETNWAGWFECNDQYCGSQLLTCLGVDKTLNETLDIYLKAFGSDTTNRVYSMPASTFCVDGWQGTHGSGLTLLVKNSTLA